MNDLPKRVAILHASNLDGIEGGAEKFVARLTKALSEQGMTCDVISSVLDESSEQAILASCERFHSLNLSEFDAVVSTKSPAHLAHHHNHVCYLQHTMRQFYDQFSSIHPRPSPRQLAIRRLVLDLDRLSLRQPRICRLFVIGRTVQRRLRHFLGVESQVLYQGLGEGSIPRGTRDYFLLPGRLHAWKRVDLGIRAMRHSRTTRKLIITGAGEERSRLERLAAGDPRIVFTGHICDTELNRRYGEAFAVLFVPIGEDFGLITLEAFAAANPVITTTDSGEPAEIVQHLRTGFVCEPTATSIAAAMDTLDRNPALAIEMGTLGRQSLHRFNWNVVGNVIASAFKTDAAVNVQGV